MTEQALKFQCPACRATLSVPASMAGVKGPCPHCRTEILAPVPGVRKETLANGSSKTGLMGGAGRPEPRPSAPAPNQVSEANVPTPKFPNGLPEAPAPSQQPLQSGLGQSQPQPANLSPLGSGTAPSPKTGGIGVSGNSTQSTGLLGKQGTGPLKPAGTNSQAPRSNGSSGNQAGQAAAWPTAGQSPSPQGGVTAQADAPDKGAKDPTGWFKDPSNAPQSAVQGNATQSPNQAGAESVFGGSQPMPAQRQNTNPFLGGQENGNGGASLPQPAANGMPNMPMPVKTGGIPAPAQPEANGRVNPVDQIAPGFSTGQLPPPGSAGTANGNGNSRPTNEMGQQAPALQQRGPAKSGQSVDAGSIWQGGISPQSSEAPAQAVKQDQNSENKQTDHASWEPAQDASGEGAPSSTTSISSAPEKAENSGSANGQGQSLFFQQPAAPRSKGPESVSAVPAGFPSENNGEGAGGDSPSAENTPEEGLLTSDAEGTAMPEVDELGKSGKDPFAAPTKSKKSKKKKEKQPAKRTKATGKKKAKGGVRLLLVFLGLLVVAAGAGYYFWPKWKDSKLGVMVGNYLNLNEKVPIEVPPPHGLQKPAVGTPVNPGSNPDTSGELPPSDPDGGEPVINPAHTAGKPGGVAVEETGTGNPPAEPGPEVNPEAGSSLAGTDNGGTDGKPSVPETTPADPNTPGAKPETTDPPVTPPVTPPSDKPKVLVDVPPVAKEAAVALDGFLRAESWEERLKHSQLPEKIKGMMKGYYSAMPDGPVDVRTIRFQERHPAPGSSYHFFVFNISTGDMPQEFPVSVEETEEGLKVDWRTFVEFKDALLMKYVASPREETGMFFVRLERAHYFEEDVPELEQKHCFRMSAPMPGHQAYAFLDKSSELATTLEEQIRWNDIMYALVHIRWTQSDEGNPYIELIGVPQYNWRSDGRGAGS